MSFTGERRELKDVAQRENQEGILVRGGWQQCGAGTRYVARACVALLSG